MRLIPLALFLLAASTLTGCASPIQLSTCVGPYMARTCASGRIDGQPVSPRRGPLESEHTSSNNEAAREQSVCEGVNLYYDYQHPCAWVHAVTYDTPPATYAVAETMVSNKPYQQYNVAIGGTLIHLGAAEGAYASSWADTVGRALAQMPPFIHALLPQPFAIVNFPTGGYFPRFCTLDFGPSGMRCRDSCSAYSRNACGVLPDLDSGQCHDHTGVRGTAAARDRPCLLLPGARMAG